MRSYPQKLRRVSAIAVTVPLFFAISTAAHADPNTLLQSAAGTVSSETNNAGAKPLAWHWKSNPEAYQPDGLSDYSEDHAVAGTQVTHPEPIPRRAAKNQIGAGRAQ